MDRCQSVEGMIRLVRLMTEPKSNANYSSLKAASARDLVELFFESSWHESVYLRNEAYNACRELRDMRHALASCTDPKDAMYVRSLLERREIAFADALVEDGWPKRAPVAEVVDADAEAPKVAGSSS